MSRTWHRLLACVACLAWLASGGVALATAADLMVMSPRAMASIPGAPATVIYLSVHNVGGVADRLVGASTPLASKVEIHSGGMNGGVNVMRPLDGITIAVGDMIEFRSGGNHLMLTGLRRPLTVGMVVPLVLRFQKAGEVRVAVPVVALAAASLPATPDP